LPPSPLIPDPLGTETGGVKDHARWIWDQENSTSG